MKKDFIDAVASHLSDEDVRNPEGKMFVVYWNDGRDVLVTEFPDIDDVGRAYVCSDFDAWARVREASPVQRAVYAARIFDEIVCSGCDPKQAAKEMLKIPEYHAFLRCLSSLVTPESAPTIN